jgi:hypothetical protein
MMPDLQALYKLDRPAAPFSRQVFVASQLDESLEDPDPVEPQDLVLPQPSQAAVDLVEYVTHHRVFAPDFFENLESVADWHFFIHQVIYQEIIPESVDQPEAIATFLASVLPTPNPLLNDAIRRVADWLIPDLQPPACDILAAQCITNLSDPSLAAIFKSICAQFPDIAYLPHMLELTGDDFIEAITGLVSKREQTPEGLRSVLAPEDKEPILQRVLSCPNPDIGVLRCLELEPELLEKYDVYAIVVREIESGSRPQIVCAYRFFAQCVQAREVPRAMLEFVMNRLAVADVIEKEQIVTFFGHIHAYLTDQDLGILVENGLIEEMCDNVDSQLGSSVVSALQVLESLFRINPGATLERMGGDCLEMIAAVAERDKTTAELVDRLLSGIDQFVEAMEG